MDLIFSFRKAKTKNVITVEYSKSINGVNNPKITLELPEQIENITIENINVLYEDELKIKNYTVDGRIINIELEGEQTQYKEETIQGATIVINAAIDVNRKSTTIDTEIKMTYKNQACTS